jgi:hypothetical protein
VVFALPFVRYTDALAFAMPLPAFFLCAAARKNRPLPRPTLAAVLMLLPALALLPLMKGSGMIASVLSLGLLMFLLWRIGQRRLALALPVVTGLCMGLLWVAAGQKIGALRDYLANALVMIAGYNDAMSRTGTWREAGQAVGLSLGFLALTGWGARRLPRSAFWPLCAGVAGLLFLVFKAGFVRQDLGHVAMTLSAIGLLFLLLAAWLERAAALMAGVTGLWLLVGPFATPGRADVPSAWYAGVSSEVLGAIRLVADPAGLARDFADSMTRVQALPWHPAGTADIYSAGQLRLFASAMPWAPRPVFQSYAAYTPALARLNLDRLVGAGGPDNVFFRPEPIDDRLPALEDGLSWPALLSQYDPVAYDPAEGLAWLRRAASSPAIPVPGPTLLSGDRMLGETVSLPPGGTALWASMDPRPTLAGRLAGVAWQVPQLRLVLSFADGRSEAFRFIPGMGRAGFLLSPVVATTIDFLRVRPGADGSVAPMRRPVALRLESVGHDGWTWRRRFHLSVSPIVFPPVSVTLAVLNAGLPQPAALPAAGGACYMDRVDGMVVPPDPPPPSWPIRMEGWVVFDAAGVPADRMDIGFQGADGRVFSVPAIPQMRPDVAAIYHLPSAAHGGFMAEVDVSHLAQGAYAVLAIAHHGDNVRACRTSLTMMAGGGH